jgi:hypothetical protein
MWNVPVPRIVATALSVYFTRVIIKFPAPVFDHHIFIDESTFLNYSIYTTV